MSEPSKKARELAASICLYQDHSEDPDRCPQCANVASLVDFLRHHIGRSVYRACVGLCLPVSVRKFFMEQVRDA